MTKFDINNIKFSKNDIQRNIQLPSTSFENLAEFLGIMAGDGFANYYQYNKSTDYLLEISGHSEEDYNYLSRYVSKIIINIFNLKPIISFKKNEKTMVLKIRSKAITQYLSEIGFPLGKKGTELKAPKWILEDKIYSINFLRGLADTDSSICFKKRKIGHSYPVIHFTSISKQLMLDACKILDGLNIKYNTWFDIKEKDKRSGGICNKHDIYICGKNNLDKWMKLIEFKNEKHLSKYLIWKEFGACPPYTLLKERKEMLRARRDSNPRLRG